MRNVVKLTTTYLIFTALLTGCGGGGGKPPADNTPPPPALSSDASLSGLTASTGNFNESFNSGTKTYTQTTAVVELSVTPTLSDANATVTVNGAAAASGSASGQIALALGSNTIAVVVTAEDGATQSTYSLSVTRLDNNATLSSLAISRGSLGQLFQSTVYSYTAQVGYVDQAITITAITTSIGSSIEIDGTPSVSGAPSQEIQLNEGSNSINIRVIAQDGTTNQDYTLVVTRDGAAAWAGRVFQDAYVKSSNSETSDAFGRSIAISGDTMVVGAYGDDSSARGVNGNQSDNSVDQSGAAYVFVRDASGIWTQQAYLKASNPAISDFFGERVAVYGDTIAVSAVLEDSNAKGIDGNQFDNTAQDSGAVYIFERQGTTWTQRAYVKSSNTNSLDKFGSRLALWGDTLAVSAIGEGGVTGAVYIFGRDGSGNWTQQARLEASNAELGDYFGRSVALHQDSLLVGALREDGNGAGGPLDNSVEDSGAAYIFQRNAGVWQQQAYLKSPSPHAYADFGFSAAIFDDTAAVSAIDGGNSIGYVYVFRRDALGFWQYEASLRAINGDDGDAFGISVGLSEDFLIAGAWGEGSASRGINGDSTDNSADGAGAAYIFSRDASGSWRGHAYIKASNTDANDRFGSFIAINGNTFGVTATFESSAARGINGNQADNNAPFSGAAYIFTF